MNFRQFYCCSVQFTKYIKKFLISQKYPNFHSIPRGIPHSTDFQKMWKNSRGWQCWFWCVLDTNKQTDKQSRYIDGNLSIYGELNTSAIFLKCFVLFCFVCKMETEIKRVMPRRIEYFRHFLHVWFGLVWFVKWKLKSLV